MSKRVTLKDIAERLSISQNTVSVALRGGSGVSESLRSQILTIAQEMGYASKHATTRPAILICSTVENFLDTYFFTDLHRFLCEKINAIGGTAVSINLDPSFSETEVTQMIRQNSACAIVLLGDAGKQIVSLFAMSGIPVLCCSFFSPIAVTDSVMEDNFSGIYQLMSHLYTHNYRQLGFVGNPNIYFAFFERLMCFRSLCDHFSIPYDPQICITDYPPEKAMSVEYMVERISTLPYTPEAFLCADDRTAILVIKALTSLGYTVPQDVAVTGFDNSDLSRLSTPTLTTIDTRIELQADTIVNRLWRRINMGNLGKEDSERLILPIQFVQGDSVDLMHKSK